MGWAGKWGGREWCGSAARPPMPGGGREHVPTSAAGHAAHLVMPAAGGVLSLQGPELLGGLSERQPELGQAVGGHGAGGLQAGLLSLQLPAAPNKRQPLPQRPAARRCTPTAQHRWRGWTFGTGYHRLHAPHTVPRGLQQCGWLLGRARDGRPCAGLRRLGRAHAAARRWLASSDAMCFYVVRQAAVVVFPQLPAETRFDLTGAVSCRPSPTRNCRPPPQI